MEKIISRRILALALDKGKVNMNIIGKNLNRTVSLWITRKDIILKNNYIVLNNK